MKSPSRDQEHYVWGVEYIPPPHVVAQDARYRKIRAIRQTVMIAGILLAWVGVSLFLTAVVTSNVTNVSANDMLLIRVVLLIVSMLLIGAVAAFIESIVRTRRQQRMKSMYRPRE